MREAAGIRSRLQFAIEAAERASEPILAYFQAENLDVELKTDDSPVTVADREAEDLLRSEIERRYPDDGILGEEAGEKPSNNGFRWILDPIDGTKSFMHGVPLFGTLVACEQEGKVVVGVCRFPALDEAVYAANGLGAWWLQGRSEPRRAQVSDVASISEALFCTTEITHWDDVGRRGAFDAYCAAARLVRGWGDCYGHMLVATGRAEIMVDPKMSAWDAAALLPILEEAGGHFVGWDGQASIHTGNGVSTNAALKDKALEILRG